MSRPEKLHCFAPAYNEGPSIGRFIEGLSAACESLEVPWELCILDDGSTDETVRHIEEATGSRPITVRSYPHRGIGALLREVVTIAHTLPARDALLFIESDGSCDPGFLPSALEQLALGADVVVASRLVPGGIFEGFPLRRRIQTHVVNRLLRLRYGVVKDFSIFARLYRVSALQLLDPAALHHEGFEANAELLIELLSRELRVAEVPLHYRYDRKDSASKLPTWRTIEGYLRLLRK